MLNNVFKVKADLSKYIRYRNLDISQRRRRTIYNFRGVCVHLKSETGGRPI